MKTINVLVITLILLTGCASVPYDESACSTLVLQAYLAYWDGSTNQPLDPKSTENFTPKFKKIAQEYEAIGYAGGLLKVDKDQLENEIKAECIAKYGNLHFMVLYGGPNEEPQGIPGYIPRVYQTDSVGNIRYDRPSYIVK